MLDFDLEVRPIRAVYILIIAALVWLATDSILGGLLTCLAFIDITLPEKFEKESENYNDESYGPDS